MKIAKRMKEAKEKVDVTKRYSPEEAINLVKETSKVKFDATVEVHANLGIDPKKSDQIIRGSVVLPHGSGKKIRIAAFVPDDQAAAAKKAGADIAGGEELIAKIKKDGKCDFDIAVTTPDMMKSLAVIARVLGQKGLMPNPKEGTIGPNVDKMIDELKKGKVSYKNDGNGNVHLAIGKTSFDAKQLLENFDVFYDSLKKAKPAALKKSYIKSLTLSSSMGPGVKVEIA